MRMLGYEMAHHGEGRWNGVAILSTGRDRGRGHELRRRAGAGLHGGGRGRGVRGRLRPVRRGAHGLRRLRRGPRREPVRAERPGRRLPVLRGQAALVRARPPLAGRDAGARRRRCSSAATTTSPRRPRTSGARPRRTAGRTSREPERAALAQPARLGPRRHVPVRAPRARPLLVVGLPGGHVPPQRGHADRPAVRDGAGRERAVWAEIDRQARKGPPTPSDHAPVVLDLDEPGSRSTPAGRAPSSGSPHGRSPGADGTRGVTLAADSIRGPRRHRRSVSHLHDRRAHRGRPRNVGPDGDCPSAATPEIRLDRPREALRRRPRRRSASRWTSRPASSSRSSARRAAARRRRCG